MKLQVCAAVTLAVAAMTAAPASAQGTFNPGRHSAPIAPSTVHGPAGSYVPHAGYGPPSGYGVENEPANHSGQHRTQPWASPPEAKPYEPPKLGPSVYSSPRSPPQGAKPCELSVYVNACDHHR